MWILLQKCHRPFLYLWIKAQFCFCPCRYMSNLLCVLCGHESRSVCTAAGSQSVSVPRLSVTVSLRWPQYCQYCQYCPQRLPHGGKRLPRHTYFQSVQQLAVTPGSKGGLVGARRIHYLRLQRSTCFHSGSCSQERGCGSLVPSSTSAQPKKQWTSASFGFVSALSSLTPGGGQKGITRGEGGKRHITDLLQLSLFSHRQLMSSGVLQVML